METVCDYLLGCAGPSEELRVYTDPLQDPTVVSDRIRHNIELWLSKACIHVVSIGSEVTELNLVDEPHTIIKLMMLVVVTNSSYC